MKCARCGNRQPRSPVDVLGHALLLWALLWFMGKVVPSADVAALHTTWWWLVLVLAIWNTFFFVVSAVVWVIDPDGYYLSPRK